MPTTQVPLQTRCGLMSRMAGRSTSLSMFPVYLLAEVVFIGNGQASHYMKEVRLGILYNNDISRCFSVENIESRLSKKKTGVKLDVHFQEVNHSNAVLVSRDVCQLVEDGIRGLITILPEGQQNIITAQAQALRLSNIVIDQRFIRPEVIPDFNINILGAQTLHADLVKDLLSAEKWTKVVLIVDEIIDSVKRRQLLKELMRHTAHFDVKTARVTKRNLVEISPALNKQRQIVFIGRGEIWRRFVKQRPHLLDREHFWIVISDITPQIITDVIKSERITNLVFVTEDWRSCVVCGSVPCSSSDKLHTDTQIKDRETFLEFWMTNSLSLFVEAVENVNLKNNASNKKPCSLFRPDPLEDGLLLQNELSRLAKERSLMRNCGYYLYSSLNRKDVFVEEVGEWRRTTGLVSQKRSLFLNTFHEFGNDPILVAATEGPPFASKVTRDGRDVWVGFSIDILDELALQMKFNYTIVEPPDNFYGGPNEDGSWNGMVGMVYRGEVEMAVGPFTITALREQVIDFTLPFSGGSTGIITLSPGFGSNKSLFQTMKPYSVPVWLTVLAAVIVVGGVSFLVNYYTPFQRDEEARPYQCKYETSLGDNMWMVFSSVTEQGIQHSPVAISGRCVLGFWWLFTILLVATYTANLAAFLTITVPPAPINSLGELLSQDRIQPIVQAGTSHETLFQESTSELYKKAWSRMQKAPKVPVHSDILDLVRTGDYAYISDSPLLEFIASNSCFTYSVAAETFDSVGYGMVLPEDAPYRDTVNTLVLKMQEAGLMKMWREKWWGLSRMCKDTPSTTANKLGLDSLGGLFLSYAGMIGLAFLCLGIEICLKSRKVLKPSEEKESKSQVEPKPDIVT